MLVMITPPVCKIAHAFTHYIPSFPENQYLFLNFLRFAENSLCQALKSLVKGYFFSSNFPIVHFIHGEKSGKKLYFVESFYVNLNV